MITILHFIVDDNEFVIDATTIDSIVQLDSNVVITKLPQYGDSSTLGVYKHHHKIYQIKDTGVLLGYSSTTTNRNYIMLLSKQIGILVDHVSTVENIDENDLTSSPVESKLIKAVYIKDNKVYPFIEG